MGKVWFAIRNGFETRIVSCEEPGRLSELGKEANLQEPLRKFDPLGS